MQPRTICATLSLATILTLSPGLFAATGVVVPPGPTGKNGNNMAKGQELKDQVMRYLGSQEVTFYNKKRTMAVFTQLDGSRPMKTVVGGKDPKDPDADIQTTVDKLTKGDVVKMTLAPWNGIMAINYIKKVDVKPAEENPHGFIFQEFYNDPSGAPIIRVTKYGESYELTLQNAKDDKGKMAPDPTLMDDVQKFKMGDAVYIDATQGRPPVISEIFPYKDPQIGKVAKVAQVDVDGGGKTSSIDIESSDGKTITALVPGKVTNKRFVADAILMRDVRQMMKPGTEVQYLTRDDNGKTYLVELTLRTEDHGKAGRIGIR